MAKKIAEICRPVNNKILSFFNDICCDLSIVFSAQGTGGSPTGPDPENRVGGQFLLGCKCPVSRGIVVQEQDPVGDLPAAFFLQNVLQLHQQR